MDKESFLKFVTTWSKLASFALAGVFIKAFNELTKSLLVGLTRYSLVPLTKVTVPVPL